MGTPQRGGGYSAQCATRLPPPPLAGRQAHQHEHAPGVRHTGRAHVHRAPNWRTGTIIRSMFKDHNEANVRFWDSPDRCGWLQKQGEYIKTWRRRWFVLKSGKIFWFKTTVVNSLSKPRGVIEIDQCLSVKGAEDAINREFAFELSTKNDTMYFIAASEKEKEDWINAVGKAIVRHSNSLVQEVTDY